MKKYSGSCPPLKKHYALGKRILLFFVVSVMLSGCELPRIWETEDVFIDMDLYGDWLLCEEEGADKTEWELTELRIIPPNSYKVFKGSDLIFSGRISAHKIDSMSCNFSFYRTTMGYSDGKVVKSSIFMGSSYMAMEDSLLRIGDPPILYTRMYQEYYFIRKE